MGATEHTKRPCTCRGYDPADPCGHGDTSEGCPRHDAQAGADWGLEAIAYSGHDLLTIEEAEAQAAERDRRANCAARQAEQVQAQADALYALHALALTDRRFAAIADSPSLEALTRDADDLSEAADEARLEALRLGYVPR